MSAMDEQYGPLLQRAMAKIEQLQEQLSGLQQRQHEPLAIVGMSCRLPGEADTPAQLWQLLVGGQDTLVEIPPERWDLAEAYHPEKGTPGKINTRHAALIREVDKFDPLFFGISPREAASMDPQQRLLLELVWEALEYGNIPADALRGSQTGTFIGNSFTDYSDLIQRDGQTDFYTSTGNSTSVMSGRIAYTLDLQGPAFTLDTACSSSLMAIHQACQSLRRGECDLAIAGAAHLIMNYRAMATLATAQMLADDGRSKAFDEAANGYGRGEGGGIVLLKRLSQARADGNQILAVILGSATNQDGASKGLTVPSGPAQEAVIRAALQDAGLEPAAINYIEAHGTGTPVGDPIEVNALGNVFAAGLPAGQQLPIGSIKTNIGHLEAAAGVAGLLKVILSLQHQTIPPHHRLQQLSTQIPWAELPLVVPTVLQAWEPAGGGRRVAGINSFGFSGSNVHLIVAEPAPEDQPVHLTEETTAPQLLPLSARSPEALRDLAERYVPFLQATSARMVDIARAAQTGRTHFRERLTVTAATPPAAAADLRRWLDGGLPATMTQQSAAAQPPHLAFLFTGQGAQYADMAAGLFATEPVFRDALLTVAEALDGAMDQPLLAVLFPAAEADRALIDQTQYTQPALFAVEYALAQLWASWGIEPAVVAGHSVGEYAAAAQAGIFSLADGARLIAARGRLMGALPAGGAMAAILTDPDLVAAAVDLFQDTVAIAALNGPANVVISGAADDVAIITAGFQDQGVRVAPLTVSHAFHSPLMEPMLAEFATIAASITYHEPTCFFVSTLTGHLASAELATADYWVRHIRQPVRFAPALQTLAAEGYSQFVEIGPQPTLLGMARRCWSAGEAAWIPSLRQGQADQQVMLNALGQLYGRGVLPDWRTLHGEADHAPVVLPTYPFQRQRYWYTRTETATQRQAALRPLIDSRVRTPAVKGTLYTTTVTLAEPAYLNDHRIFQFPIFPGAGYMEMAFEAAREEFGAGNLLLQDLTIQEGLVLPEEEAQTIQLVAEKNERGVVHTVIHSESGDSWKQHFSAELARGAERVQEHAALDALRARFNRPVPGADFYKRLAADGYNFGPGFQSVTGCQILSANELLTRVELPDALQVTGQASEIHPALLDAVFQPVAYGLIHRDDHVPDTLLLPVFVGSMTLYQGGHTSGWAYSQILEVNNEFIRARGEFFADDGRPILIIEEFVSRRTTQRVLRRLLDKRYSDWFYEIAWRRQAIAESVVAPAGRLLLFVNDEDEATPLLAALQARGQSATVVAGAAQGSRPVGADRWAVAWQERETLERWLTEWLADSAEPYAGAIVLWGLAAQATAAGAPLAQQAQLTGAALNLTQALLTAAPTWLAAEDGPRLLFVTAAGQPAGDGLVRSPAAAALAGFAHTVALERPELRPSYIDVEPGTDWAAQVLAEFDQPGSEDQVALRPDGRYVARLIPAESEPLPLPEGDSFALTFTSRGTLENLELQPVGRPGPGPGQVEIKVRAAGLNFRDVLNVLDMYPGDPGPIGGECAGTVVALGDGVTHLAVGDEVLALVTGCFASYALADADFVFAKPANLSFAEAATIPITFLTAYYGLHELAGIRPEDKVLIHAASGGVGMAAIQLCRQVGAEIFGTAGAQAKRDLIRSLGVDHVHYSRNLDFAAEIMAITGGRGVDIVLNSLADEFIPKSLEILADKGRFLEIGKRGVWSEAQVHALNDTLGYWVYDLGELMARDPALIREMMAVMLPAFATGELKPLPLRAWPLQNASAAFRFMAQAKHVGKIVLTVPHYTIEAEATYLITGGTGGIGRLLLDWLVAQGARHIVLNSRRGASPELAEALARLAETGVEAEVVAADIGQPEQFARLAERLADLPPLRGVFHTAGVLDDGALLNQNWERCRTVMQPKVAGTWHLHEYTRSLGLDHFVLYSSIAAVVGNPGQTTYAAANAFMDGLANLRQQQGLPALSVNWGAWGEVGMLAASSVAALEASGFHLIAPEDGTAALQQASRRGVAQLTIAPLNWPQLRQRVGAKPFYEEISTPEMTASPGAPAGAGSGDFLQELLALPAEARRQRMLAYVAEQIGHVLGVERQGGLDTQLGLFDLGMDSLTAVEFSNRLKATFNHVFPPTLAFETPTIDALTDYLLALVAEKVGATAEQEGATAPQ